MKRNHMIALALTAVLTACQTTSPQQKVTYPTASMPGLSEPVDIAGELFKPEGDGPFPAVIVLHGSGGISEHYRGWARKLVSWGYVALMTDSFGPRGYGSIMSSTPSVMPQKRVSDVIGAAEWLSKQPYVAKGRIGTIGFSHGGWTTMKLVQADMHAKEYGIKGSVAYYPLCDVRTEGKVDIPVLILIGEKDDWTPAFRCQELVASPNLRRKDLVDLVVYPNVYHSFDEYIPRPVTVMGTSIGGKTEPKHLEMNPAAAADAEKRTKAFFDRLLKN